MTDADGHPLSAAWPSPSDHEEVFMHLERDQLVAGRHIPVGRAELGSSARLGLWALRVFVLVVSAMVIYTFISQLGS